MSTPLPVIEPVHSPIIGRPIDNTALATYMSCPRKYLYSMVWNRRREGAPTPALAYGSAWHVAMETHYRSDRCSQDELFDKVQLAVAEAWQDHQSPNDYRTFNRLMVEYKKYVKAYGLPWNEEAKVLGWVENPFVEIATDLSIPGARHSYAGKMDKIIELSGQVLVEDYKTSSREDKNFFSQFELSNQMMGYAVLGQLLIGRQISGVRINAHVIRKNDSVFNRRVVSFSKERLDHWMLNYDAWLARIETDMGLAMRPETARFAFPHNFDACAGKYGMCQYASVCSMPPHLRQRVLEEDFQVAPWNPLEVEDASEA